MSCLSSSGASIRWQRPVPADAGALRLQVTFAGIRPEDGRLYAIYAGS